MPVARCPLTVARCPISNVNALIDLTTLSQTPLVSRMSVVLLQYSFGQRTTDNAKSPFEKGLFLILYFSYPALLSRLPASVLPEEPVLGWVDGAR